MRLYLFPRPHPLGPIFNALLLCCCLCVASAQAYASPQNSIKNNSATPQASPQANPQTGTISTSPKPSPAPTAQAWQNLEPGLDQATFTLFQAENAKLTILRFSPKHFSFTLHTISENNTSPQTLNGWAQSHNLVAAINASMYLPDGATSTGYMRTNEHTNNTHIAKAFGAFFVANPTEQDLPEAALIEKNTPNLKDVLSKYSLVIQNYRLISHDRQILWTPKGQKHSIAAVGQDAEGRILFLHCRKPIEPHALGVELLRLPLDIRTVMYVEGGAQAGMVLRINDKSTFWGGRHPADFFMGSVGVALPNILGVRRKKTTNQ